MKAVKDIAASLEYKLDPEPGLKPVPVATPEVDGVNVNAAQVPITSLTPSQIEEALASKAEPKVIRKAKDPETGAGYPETIGRHHFESVSGGISVVEEVNEDNNEDYIAEHYDR